MPNNPLQVVIGILFNDQQQVLVSLRPPHVPMPGLWEFPGGKVEMNESYLQAITRELKEELNITITHAVPFMNFIHDYGDRQVALNVWHIQQYSGIPIGAEGQQIHWATMSDLLSLSFLAGSYPIIEKIKNMLAE